MNNEIANKIANILINSINNEIANNLANILANHIINEIVNNAAHIFANNIINEIADDIANNRAFNFDDFWGQGHKVIKSRLLGVILSISGAKARKQCAMRALCTHPW